MNKLMNSNLFYELKFLNKKKKYILSVSGGKDSMFMLDLLNYYNFSFIVVNINYKIRRDSYFDQFLVDQFCKKEKIILFKKTINFYQKGNFENQARNIRFKFLQEIANKNKIYNVIIAHNFEDKIETYLIQQEKRNIVNYYGLNKKTFYKNLTIYRPFLNIKKSFIINYLFTKKINFAIDSTNMDINYLRNYYRLNYIDNLTFKQLNSLDQEIVKINCFWKRIKRKNLIINKKIKENKFKIDNFKLLPFYRQQMIIYQVITFSKLIEIEKEKLKKKTIKEIVKIISQT
jgi:tRNA(Ile)-lysidine synthase